jgi:dTDP-glucose 4,6-dehydratase/UDP-glucose 4-epimerase
MHSEKKILIVGSEGFFGKQLAVFFNGLNYQVHTCDVLSIQKENYTQLVNTASDLETVFSNENFFLCINAAGSAHVQFSYTNHHNDYILNTHLVFEILTALRKHSPDCRFINFSSAAVYGNPTSLPISEQHKLAPLSPYGLHKVYSEQICQEFHDFFQIKTVSLRVFSAYGPGLKKQLIWDLHQKATQGNTVTLFGTGSESRDFIYISDILEAVNCIIQKHPFNGSAINVSSGVETSIHSVANIYYSLFKTPIDIVFSGTEKVGDPQNWRADISTLKELGFEPKFSLEDGLKNFHLWASKLEQ